MLEELSALGRFNNQSVENNDIPQDPPLRHGKWAWSAKTTLIPSFFGIESIMENSTIIRYDQFEDANSTMETYMNVTSENMCLDKQLTSYFLNVTCELPINYAQPMYGYIAPFLLATTTIANTLIVVVLSRRHMRSPTNAVLMAMALCDMFTLLFPAPWLFYMYTFGNHYKPLSPVEACYAWNIMNEVSAFPICLYYNYNLIIFFT